MGEGDSKKNGEGDGVGEGIAVTGKENNRHYMLFISVLLCHVGNCILK